MSFSYDTFANPSASIRLLKIVPDVDEATVRCSIDQYRFQVDHSYQKCPEYCAISYTWSPVKPYQAIKLNGQHFSIGYNLWLLLKQLRRAGQQWFLWVDALCINQAKIDEKNAQVAIMRLIYRSASHVFAWLGEASTGIKSSGLSFRVEASSDAIIKKLNDDHEHCSPSPGYVKDTLGVELSIKSVSLWNGLTSLCGRDYWARTWILQEISQNPDSVVLHCGSSSIRLNTLRREIRRAVNKLHSSLQYGKVLSGDLDMNLSDRLTENDVEKDKYCSDLRKQLRKSADDILKNTLLGSTTEWNELSLLAWFRIASHTFCLDPRDKVYSIVDLAHGEPRRRNQSPMDRRVRFIRPDYSKPTITLLWEVLAHLCESGNHKSLDIRFVQYLTTCLMISNADIQHILNSRPRGCPAHLFHGHGGIWEWAGDCYVENAEAVRRSIEADTNRNIGMSFLSLFTTMQLGPPLTHRSWKRNR